MSIGIGVAMFLGLVAIVFGIHHSLAGRLDTANGRVDTVLTELGEIRTSLGELDERSKQHEKQLHGLDGRFSQLQEQVAKVTSGGRITTDQDTEGGSNGG